MNGPLFKRKKAGAGGSVAHFPHDALANVPPIMCHVNMRSRQPPWLSQKIVGPELTRRNAAARGQVELRSKPRENKSQGAGRQLETRSGHQLVRSWSRHVSGWPVTLRETSPQDRRSPSRMKNPGTLTESS
jgi:hypothetical protein